MKFIVTISILLAATIANSQEIATPNSETKFKLVPAVKTTATVFGESYVISRDENDKIVFVKKSDSDYVVRPMIIKLEAPQENP